MPHSIYQMPQPQKSSSPHPYKSKLAASSLSVMDSPDQIWSWQFTSILKNKDSFHEALMNPI